MTSPSNPQPSGTPPRKILVVDDNPVIIKTVTLKLKSKGYDVCSATDGSEAMRAVRQEHPDLILLDISFPPDVAHGGGVAWDGFLIMDWLRRSEEARHIPIIIITGGEVAKLEERARSAGAAAFFHKPIDHAELLAVIERTLAKAGSPGSGSQT